MKARSASVRLTRDWLLASLLLVWAVVLPGCVSGFAPAQASESVLVQAPPLATMPPVALHLAVEGEFADLAAEMAAAYPEKLSEQVAPCQAGVDLVYSGYADAALVWGPPPTVADPLVAEAVAADALAIVVNPANRVGPLDTEQLADIFTGRTQEWSSFGQSLGSMQVVGWQPGSGAAAALSALILQGGELTSTALIAGSSDAVLDSVAARPGAIGFLPASELRAGVRVVTVGGVRPEPSRVRRGEYPLMTGVWLVLRKGGAGEEFLAFLQSQEGQAILSSHYAPRDVITRH